MISAMLAKMTGALAATGIMALAGDWMRRSFSDKIDGEPLLAEEALVHAKSDHGTEYDHFYIIHFYVAARNEVVNCEVTYELWRNLPMKSRGTLTHQGGMFYSFESHGTLYHIPDTQ